MEANGDYHAAKKVLRGMTGKKRKKAGKGKSKGKIGGGFLKKSKAKSKAKKKIPRRVAQRREKRRQQRKSYELWRQEQLANGLTQEDLDKQTNLGFCSSLIEAANTSHPRRLNPPREGMGLIVLDMDYTMFDFKTKGVPLDQLKRPHLHEFLKAVYECYDLAVWSQTTPKRLRSVLTELGVWDHKDYKLTFVVDSTAMYSITHMGKEGKVESHEVKDLHYIWGKFPEFYNPCNTLHVDDLQKNFAMNEECGIVVPPFTAELREAKEPDPTLVLLKEYLVAIKDFDDYSHLDHMKWQEFVLNLRETRDREKSVEILLSYSSYSWSSSEKGPIPKKATRPQDRSRSYSYSYSGAAETDLKSANAGKRRRKSVSYSFTS